MTLSTLVAIGRGPGDRAIATFRPLDETDLPAIHGVREEVLSCLPNRDYYIPHAQEASFVRAHLGTAGVSVGMEVDSRLIGYSALSLDIDQAMLDGDFQQRIAAWCAASGRSLRECCVLAVTMVQSGYTGFGLHRAAIDVRLKRARDLGKTSVFAMVSPHNRRSLDNLSGRGLRVEDVIDFADGRTRCFLAGSTESAPSSIS